MIKFIILFLTAALVGCATKPSSRSAGEYRLPLTNGFIAFVQADGNTLRVLVKHGDDFITDLMTDGERVQFTQNLGFRHDKTAEEKDSGLGSVVWIATDKGKLTRHTSKRSTAKDNCCFTIVTTTFSWTRGFPSTLIRTSDPFRTRSTGSRSSFSLFQKKP